MIPPQWYVYDPKTAEIKTVCSSEDQARQWRARQQSVFAGRLGQGPLFDWYLAESRFFHDVIEKEQPAVGIDWHTETYTYSDAAAGHVLDHVGIDKTLDPSYNRVVVMTKERKMQTVTLSGEDFKIIHNTLCDLRNLVQRLEQSMIKTNEFDRIIEGFQMGLKDAYEQDNSAFDRKMDYYNQFRAENSLSAVWSIFNLDEGDFDTPHPWQGAVEIRYHQTSAPIKGTTWADLYRAADLAIQRSGDDHHIFIEGFGPYTAGDNSVLWLTTGS